MKPVAHSHTHFDKAKIKAGAVIQHEQQRQRAEKQLEQDVELEKTQEEIKKEVKKEEARLRRADGMNIERKKGRKER